MLINTCFVLHRNCRGKGGNICVSIHFSLFNRWIGLLQLPLGTPSAGGLEKVQNIYNGRNMKSKMLHLLTENWAHCFKTTHWHNKIYILNEFSISIILAT